MIADHLELITVDKVIDHGDYVRDLREGDPHVWLDPRMVLAAIPIIEAHLTSLDPAAAEGFEASAAAYASRVEALDAELVRGFAAIPAERRTLIVFHDAYTSFAARYDVELVAIVLRTIAAEHDVAIGELLTDSFAGRVDSCLALMRFNRDSLVHHLDGA